MQSHNSILNIYFYAIGENCMSGEYIDIFMELDRGGSRSKELLDILDMELSLPNIPFPTMVDEVFWNTLVEYNG